MWQFVSWSHDSLYPGHVTVSVPGHVMVGKGSYLESYTNDLYAKYLWNVQIKRGGKPLLQ